MDLAAEGSQVLRVKSVFWFDAVLFFALFFSVNCRFRKSWKMSAVRVEARAGELRVFVRIPFQLRSTISRPCSVGARRVVENGRNKHSSLLTSLNGNFESILFTLMRKSPTSVETPSTTREERWKIAVAISGNLKEGWALLEASRLRHSVLELEKKLNKLELYCLNLKYGLEECSNTSPYRMENPQNSHPISYQNTSPYRLENLPRCSRKKRWRGWGRRT